MSRRALLQSAALAAIAAGTPGRAPAAAAPVAARLQPGILERRQRTTVVAAFTCADVAAASLRELLAAWTALIPRLAREEPGLTVTVGFGPTLLERAGRSASRPADLAALPALRGEALVPERGGGDLLVQVCADREAAADRGLAALRTEAGERLVPTWAQHGFVPAGRTPRNLLGFKDGTRNIEADDGRGLREHVVVRGGPQWLQGGSFLVLRRIRIDIAAWDAYSARRQELAVGRHRASGAPLGRRRERDPLGLGRLDDEGRRVIPLGAHVRHAAPGENGGARMLRRGYSYDDGPGDAGLLFLAYHRAPHGPLLRVLRQLATYDRLNAVTTTVASGVYACPPSAPPGRYLGAPLFD